MLLSKCAVYIAKKLKFIKQKGAIALWSRLEIKAPLSKISLVVPLFFFLIVLNKIIQGIKWMK